MVKLDIPVPKDTYDVMVAPRAEAILREFAVWTRNLESRRLTEEELASRAGDIEGMVVSWEPITRRVLDAAPRLRIIGKMGGAVGHIDLATCFERGITVVNASDATDESVAEFTLALILAALRDLPGLVANLRQAHVWDDRLFEELAGKSVGIVGLGAISRRLIALLRPFGCRVLLHSAHATREEATALGVELVSLDEVCRCEIVTLHCSLTPRTAGLIGRRELALLPDGALLVNTSRGKLVDESALLDELRAGRIRAALDVFPLEPLPDDSPLYELPGVLLTPHRAGATRQAYARLGSIVAENLRVFFRGETPHNQITPEKLTWMTTTLT